MAARRDTPVRHQLEQTLAGGETVRLAEADRRPAEGETTRTGEGRLGVRVRMRRLEPARILKLRTQCA